MKTIRRALACTLAFLLSFTALCLPTSGETASVLALDGTPVKNLSANDYVKWSSPVRSGLSPEADGGFVRAAAPEEGPLLVEWYNADGKLQREKTAEFPLPRFGGFFFGKAYNFAVFGKNNLEDDPNAEVLRVVKYDKDMNVLAETPLYGMNTYKPFEAGSCRFVEVGNRLYIYTCHEMFDRGDGLHHQANMTLVFSQETLELTDSFCGVANIRRCGYVSHSFNQFIAYDGEYVYRADHGDAHPRAISITMFDPRFTLGATEFTTPLTFPGTEGVNSTGATLGGMALVGDRVLLAGTIDSQTAEYSHQYDNTTDEQLNIFVISSAKTLEDSENLVVRVTDYAPDAGIEVRTPQIVALDGSALLLWEEKTADVVVTRAVVVGTKGEKLTETYTLEAFLSDCPPAVSSDGTVCWIVSDDETVRLYRLDPNDLGGFVPTEHNWRVKEVLVPVTCETDGRAKLVCSVCGLEKTDVLPATGHDWSSFKHEDIAWHTRVCRNDPSHVDRQKHTWTVEFSEEDPPTATQGGVGRISCDDCRVFYPRLPLPAFDVKGMFFNQDYHLRYQDETHSRMIAEEHEMGEWKVTLAPTCTEDGERTRECVGCPLFETEPMDAAGHEWGAWTTTKAPTATQSGEESRVCANCGETQSRALPPTGGTFLLGDVDFDGVITAADARLALRRAVELETYAPGSRAFFACDADRDNAVTAADARRILRAAVDLEDPATW